MDNPHTQSLGWIDGRADEFEAAWKKGQRPSLAQFLGEATANLRLPLLRELLAIELHYRQARGENPTLDEYRYLVPENPEALREILSGDTGIGASAWTVPGSAPEELTQVGRFQVRRVLGVGAFGTVYLAHDPQLAREVALKVPNSGALDNPQRVERFLREARAAARLRHPHIVPVFEAGQDGERYYIASAFIEGRSLAWVLAAHPQGLECVRAARIVRALAEALACAHEQGIVHRDVKPANVMLDKKDHPLLMDFGLASRLEGEAKLTKAGTVLGTPAYMAPEQAEGQGEAQPASDQYSLGVVLYELLTGHTPFTGSPLVVLNQAIHTQPKPPGQVRAGLPADLEAICLKALAKNPEERYPSCLELAHALSRWLAKEAAPTFLFEEQAGRTEENSAIPAGRIRARGCWFGGRGLMAAAVGLAALGLFLLGITIVIKYRRPDGKTSELTIQVHSTTEITPPTSGGGKTSPPPEEKGSKPAGPLPARFRNRLGMEFALVNKGRFWMGGTGGHVGDKEVEIPEDFYLGLYEVTQGDWEAVTGANPSYFSPLGEGRKEVEGVSPKDLKKFPVENVSWNDVQAFLARLNERHGEPGWRYRLPTEAEWEYACRGGPLADRLEQGFDYYFEKPGNELLAGQANFKSGKGMKRTGTVGSYRPNRLGLFDMHGNVSEWCEDEERDPKGASLRVARGGAFDDDPWNCRAAHHASALPATLDGCVGFRLVRGIFPKKK